MEWDKEAIQKLDMLFTERWQSMRDEKRTDRKNLSCHWNRYLKQYEVRVLRFGERKPNEPRSPYLSASQRLQGFISLINFKNDEVANGLVIDNPDRPGQHILISRDMAERILVFGMI
jgi:hypothetical protein